MKMEERGQVPLVTLDTIVWHAILFLWGSPASPEPIPVDRPCMEPSCHLSSQASMEESLPAVVAQIPWSSWEEAEILDVLIYLRGSEKLRLPQEWVDAVPTLAELNEL